MAERICTTCGETKPATPEFFHRKRGGLHSECKTCRKARARRRYEARRQEILASAAAYRKNNPDKRRTMQVVYLARPEVREARQAADRAYAGTPEGRAHRRAANQRFRETEHGRLVVLIAAHHGRARTAGVASDLTVEQWQDILAAFDHRCAYCGSTKRLTIEHVVPIERGGANTRSNVIPACWSCNHSKRAADMTTWYRRQPFFDQARLDRITVHAA